MQQGVFLQPGVCSQCLEGVPQNVLPEEVMEMRDANARKKRSEELAQIDVACLPAYHIVVCYSSGQADVTYNRQRLHALGIVVEELRKDTKPSHFALERYSIADGLAHGTTTLKIQAGTPHNN